MTTPWPLRHFGLKILSVGLAALLWMVVSGEETVERGLSIPLELQQFPPALELQTKPPSTVDVRVRGGSGTLSRLTPVDIVAVLDLRGAQVGQRLFHLTPEQVRIPFGVEKKQIFGGGGRYPNRNEPKNSAWSSPSKVRVLCAAVERP